MYAFVISRIEQQSLRRQRVFRDRRHPLDLNDNQIKELFRFSRPNLIKIIDDLSDKLQKKSRRNNPITGSIQVCIGLHYLATGSFQSTVANLLDVSQSSISRCYFNFVQCVVERYSSTISFENVEEIQAKFFDVCGLPQICGAIDCTHIEILRPHSGFYPNEYINRKGWHSINVLAICDSRGKFLDVTAAWPGCVHDSRVFRNTLTYEYFCAGKFGQLYLIGDSGFQLTPFLMTPYSNPSTPMQQQFNESLSRGRVSIEMAFGRLKRRFACLYRILQVPLERVCKVIMACFILHNLALLFDDPDFDQVIFDVRENPSGEEPFEENRFYSEGRRKRRELTQIFD